MTGSTVKMINYPAPCYNFGKHRHPWWNPGLDKIIYSQSKLPMTKIPVTTSGWHFQKAISSMLI
jgi:hypothetical protein